MATVESKGPGLQASLAAALAKLTSARQVRVGFLDGASYPDGTPVALVAAVQNYGGGAIPPRPFMDRTVQEHQGEWGPELAALLKQDLDAEKALRTMGQRIKEEVQASILEGDYAPNAMVTNLLKQRFPLGGQTFGDVIQAWRDVAAGATEPAGKPLVQSAHLVDSVDYEVTP